MLPGRLAAGGVATVNWTTIISSSHWTTTPPISSSHWTTSPLISSSHWTTSPPISSSHWTTSPPISPSHQSSSPPAVPLLPLSRSLDYLRSLQPRLPAHYFLGLLFLAGQLEIIEHHYRLSNKDWKKINHLKTICNGYLAKNPQWVSQKTVQKVSKGLSWIREIKHGVKPVAGLSYRLEDRLTWGRPTPAESDLCLLETLGEVDRSGGCLEAERDPSAAGYTLAHQAIYFTLRAALDRDQYLRDSLLPELCGRMLAEVGYSMGRGPPAELLDLLIEEVALCGMINYEEFLKNSTLEFIISLQEENGCFSYRSLNSQEDECDDHLTAVSMLALGNFLQNNLKYEDNGDPEISISWK